MTSKFNRFRRPGGIAALFMIAVTVFNRSRYFYDFLYFLGNRNAAISGGRLLISGSTQVIMIGAAVLLALGYVICRFFRRK